MPKSKTVTAMLALEELRDCGKLTAEQHIEVYQMCEDLQDIYKDILDELRRGEHV